MGSNNYISNGDPHDERKRGQYPLNSVHRKSRRRPALAPGELQQEIE